MKQLLLLSLVTFTFSLFSQNIIIPNYYFKQDLIKGFDKNNDGEIQISEVEQITELSLNNPDIYDIKGIEYFTNLKVLNISDMYLKYLDLSKNINLTELYFGNDAAGLNNLDISKNIKLVKLTISGSRLKGLNLSKILIYNI